jgi:DNA adenine methylase
VIWRSTIETDIVANELADRHYSRQTPGCGQVGPPGSRIVLVSICGRALWISQYTRYPDDGLDAYRCSIFRNEGAGLSSTLIAAAMEVTEENWGPAPDGWVTWVDVRRIRSTNPGYCFLAAGWSRDDGWSPARGRRGRVRLRAVAKRGGASAEAACPWSRGMKATSTSRSPIPWFGGKQKLADQIIALFPAHDSYVEVFGGGASVLLSKPPATLEIYNDLDDGLVTFFRALRDQPDELVPMLELSPYSRSEWQRCRETWREEGITDVERARRWFVVATQSFGAMTARGREGWDESGVRIPEPAWRRELRAGGGPAGWKDDRGPNGERHHGRGWGGERLGRMYLSRAASNANRIDHIWRFVERLRVVQIENLDWRACLERYDHADAVFYLDPPYVPATRRAGGYEHELGPEDHEELVERVLALTGVVVISGYDHELYAPLVDVGGFTRHEYGVWSSAGRKQSGDKRDRRVEVVWASPHAAMPTLFTAAAGVA